MNTKLHGKLIWNDCPDTNTLKHAMKYETWITESVL